MHWHLDRIVGLVKVPKISGEIGSHGFVLVRSLDDQGSPGQIATVEVVLESVNWDG